MKRSPRSPQLEKTRVQQRRPNATKNKYKKIIKKKKRCSTALSRAFRERSTSEKTQPGSAQGVASRGVPSSKEKGSFSSADTACPGLVSGTRVRFPLPLVSLVECLCTMHRLDNCTGRPTYVTAFSLTHPEPSKPRAGITPTRKRSLTFSGIRTWGVKSLFLFPCALYLIPVQQLLHLIITVAIFPPWVKILRVGTVSISIS